MRIPAVAVLGTIALIGAASGSRGETQSLSGLSCYGTQQPKQVAELLFGRAVAGKRAVSGAAWARFVARELTPRFPDGMTITDAAGQWRNPRTGTIVREASKHVEIVLAGNAGDEALLDQAAAAYKREFHQQSVGIIVRPACVSF
jgi:hypothetical protein